MKLDGDYIIFTGPEVPALKTRVTGDQYRYQDRAHTQEWNACSTDGVYEKVGYQSNGYDIRRLLSACTPEQRTQAGGGIELEHFIL